MADMNDPIPGSGVSFWSLAACLGGSLLTLRTVVETSPGARMAAVGSSFVLAFFLGPAIAEHTGAGPRVEKGIMLLTAFVGVNFLSGIAVFLAKWRTEPAEAIQWLFSLWRGTK